MPVLFHKTVALFEEKLMSGTRSILNPQMHAGILDS